MTLTYRKLNGDLPRYRVSFEGVDVGSIAVQTNYIERSQYWHWRIHSMPLLSGPNPDGKAESFDAAMEGFKLAFAEWLAKIPSDKWQENLERLQGGQDHWRTP